MPAMSPSPIGTAANCPRGQGPGFILVLLGESDRATKGPAEILYQTIITRAVRCLDPFVQLRGRWIVRRLESALLPHRTRHLRAQGQELRLLRAMGWETANIHLGTRTARKSILRHMQKQKGKWLHHAAEAMLKAVRGDWEIWKKRGYN